MDGNRGANALFTGIALCGSAATTGADVTINGAIYAQTAITM